MRYSTDYIEIRSSFIFIFPVLTTCTLETFCCQFVNRQGRLATSSNPPAILFDKLRSNLSKSKLVADCVVLGKELVDLKLKYNYCASNISSFPIWIMWK